MAQINIVKRVKSTAVIKPGSKNKFQVNKLTFHLKLLYYNPLEQDWLPLPAGLKVKMYDHDTISSDDFQGQGETTGDDTTVKIVADKDEDNPDLYFKIETGKKFINLESKTLESSIENPSAFPFIALPEIIDSREKKDTNKKEGYLESYKGKGEGTAENPWTFKLEDVRIFIGLKYYKGSTGTFEPMPNDKHPAVCAYDSDTLSNDDLQAMGSFIKPGLVYLPVFAKDESKPDLFFSIKNKGDIILDREAGAYVSSADSSDKKNIKLPEEWKSKENHDSANGPGIKENFAEAAMGTMQSPWEFIYPAGGVVAIKSMPKNFAPSIETCSIEYTYTYSGDSKDVRDLGKIIIYDKDKTEIFTAENLRLDREKSLSYEWDGKDKNGNYVGPNRSPFKVSLSLSDRPEIKDEKELAIEVESITLELTGLETYKGNEIVVMNNPENTIEVSASPLIKKTDGTGAAASLPVDVTFTFSDPNGKNTKKTDSYKYATGPDKYLAKDVNSDTFWKECSGSAAASTDDYKGDCTASGNDQGIAKCYFIPSGAGGDTFIIKASILAPDGTTELISRESKPFTVWREVEFKAYEMTGKNHISENTTEAKMTATGYFDEAAFVKYTLGEIRKIPEKYCVKYIGLWDSGAGAQKNWEEDQKKRDAEIPEKTDTERIVKIRAQNWVTRIINEYNDSIEDWIRDAGIETPAIIGVDDFHPKMSGSAPNKDANTNTWRKELPGVKLKHYGKEILPDERWTYAQGLCTNETKCPLINGNMDPEPTISAIVHEIGHATNGQFERELFGVNNSNTASGEKDHSADRTTGIMERFGMGRSFSSEEIDILRGLKG